MSFVIKDEDMLTTKACKTCMHKHVCKLSKNFEELSKELKEKIKLTEYQHFTPDIKCNFYEKAEETIMYNVDNDTSFE